GLSNPATLRGDSCLTEPRGGMAWHARQGGGKRVRSLLRMPKIEPGLPQAGLERSVSGGIVKSARSELSGESILLALAAQRKREGGQDIVNPFAQVERLAQRTLGGHRVSAAQECRSEQSMGRATVGRQLDCISQLDLRRAVVLLGKVTLCCKQQAAGGFIRAGGNDCDAHARKYHTSALRKKGALNRTPVAVL